MKTYDTADICEEAHKRTEIECSRKKIKMDIKDNDMTSYTEKAQVIFDKHFDDVEDEWS